MDWINNPWVVGIGGGVLSGLLVTVISRALLSRRDRREYIQKLLSANQEILYALRPGVSEGSAPKIKIVECLINATARKHAVDKSDLLSVRQLGEELTKEIMDSSFISWSTKQEYCLSLESLTGDFQDGGGLDWSQLEPSRKSELAEYRSRMVTTMSLMLGLMTALMSILFAFSGLFKNDGLGSPLDSVTLLLPATAAISTAALAALLMLFRNESKKSIKKREEDHVKNSSDRNIESDSS